MAPLKKNVGPFLKSERWTKLRRDKKRASWTKSSPKERLLSTDTVQDCKGRWRNSAKGKVLLSRQPSPPLLPTLLVLVLFLKLRNCELRFLKRNRFIYSIKVAKELELRFLRCQNRLSTKLGGGGKKKGWNIQTILSGQPLLGTFHTGNQSFTKGCSLKGPERAPCLAWIERVSDG